MAPRRVIADSEDEDEGDDVFLPHLEVDLDRPEPEPLSPHGQPSGLVARESDKQSSDVTDPSFFANIYSNQQDLAVQQSHLIETIVRQSQRASASSGHVSLSSKKNGRRADPSSGTDVTSPMILSRPRNHTVPFNDDASNFTTPRKSLGQVWEIPSSPEDATLPQNAGSARRQEKTDGKMKRGRPKLVSSPVPAEVSPTEETTPRPPLGNVGLDYQPEGGPRTDSPSLPAAKGTKGTRHDPTLSDTTKFYIAQSNLTTMQKLEYQKVNVSMNGYGGLPGSLPNHKSSGATTIPYSTPSGYSSIPPLPWEESLAQPSSPQRNVAININSSPDVIGNGFDLPNERSPIAGPETETSVPNRNYESPVRPQSRTSVVKGKKRAAQDIEEDELCRADTWDPDDIDVPQDSYKPRATKRRAVLAEAFSDIGIRTDTLENISDEAVIQIQDPPELPSTLEPPPPETQPKKRGRKKKQHTIENPLTETDTNEDLHSNQNPTSPEKVAEAEHSPEKPKKKRGRPRKSGPSKAAEEPIPEPPMADEPPITDPPQQDDNPDTPPAAVPKKQENRNQKAQRKKGKASEEVEDPEPKDDRLPLKELDSNLQSPSKLASTDEETPAKTKTKTGSGEEKSTPKPQSKETSKPAASQSKPTYRVGLSKRSRIAPLLKSIRK
ncbi:hypothetical protein F4859DRAFT_528401 [Xylaria cf. heliscus]|nr:hypothetical protein F4859DRAFT_528401 [Xylaria cf. heliscus]